MASLRAVSSRCGVRVGRTAGDGTLGHDVRVGHRRLGTAASPAAVSSTGSTGGTGSSAGSGARAGTGIGRGGGGGGGSAMAATRMATAPNARTSPGSTTALSTRTPLWKVPLREPRSRTVMLPPAQRSSACRREIVGSASGTSLVEARPTITDAPSRSAYASGPEMPTSL
jgi:hypothetical protein